MNPHDGKGNPYFDVENIRIINMCKTNMCKTNMCKTNMCKTNMNGNSGLRIQVYKAGGDLFREAEIPIPDRNVAFDLLKAIYKALETNGL